MKTALLAGCAVGEKIHFTLHALAQHQREMEGAFSVVTARQVRVRPSL